MNRISPSLCWKAKKISRPKETHKERLTVEEFRLLAETATYSELMKNAAMFSGLTGLRWSDVSTLKWSNIRGKPGSIEIQFSQEKTENAEILPISDQAYGYLGEKQSSDTLLFPGLVYSRLKSFFDKWLADAGIVRNITLHSFRTVSKLLGHRVLKTTEFNAKIVDKSKRLAANKNLLKGEDDNKETEDQSSRKGIFILHINEDKINAD